MLAVSDHDLVVQIEFKNVGRCLQLALCLDVFPSQLGIAGRWTTIRAKALRINARFIGIPALVVHHSYR